MGVLTAAVDFNPCPKLVKCHYGILPGNRLRLDGRELAEIDIIGYIGFSLLVRYIGLPAIRTYEKIQLAVSGSTFRSG